MLQVHDLKVELRNIKAGLHNTSRFIQEPKDLKESIKALYRKHLQDYDTVNHHSVYFRYYAQQLIIEDAQCCALVWISCYYSLGYTCSYSVLGLFDIVH